jgi:lysophospholipase L1-like esterase
MINLALSTTSTAVLAGRPSGPPPLTLATRHVHGTYLSTAGIGVYGNWTWHQLLSLAAPFQAVRIGLPNTSNLALPGVIASIAPTNTLANVRDPQGAVWTRMLFGGANSATLPVCTDAALSNVTWSDWSSVPSVARADGGAFPLLMLRVYNPQPGYPIVNLTSSPVNFPTKFEAANGGRVTRFFGQAAVDGVTTPASFTTTSLNTNYGMPVYVQYKTQSRVVTVYGCGDSITAGYDGEGRVGWASRATFAAATAQKPTEYCCGGMVSQPGSKYLARLSMLIGDIKPTVVSYMAVSTNDPSYGSPAATVAQKAQTNSMIALCTANGATPLVLTPLPWELSSATQQAELALMRDWVKALPQNTVDLSPLHGATFGRWLATTRTSDGTHPSELGTAEIAAIVASRLSAVAASL